MRGAAVLLASAACGLLALLTEHAHASAGAAIATMAQPPYLRPFTTANVYQRHLELPDWRDPRVGTTVRLDHQCEHTVELALTGNELVNSVTLIARNDSAADARVLVDEAQATFDDGEPERLTANAAYPVSASAAGATSVHSFAFPTKASFATARAVTVRIPFALARGKCAVTATFERDDGVPRRVETYTEYGEFTRYVGGGWGTTTGGLGRIAGHGVSIDFGFQHLLSLHHGYAVDLMMHFWGNSLTAPLEETVGSVDDTTLFAMGVYGSYAFRWVFGRRVSLSYAPGLGLYWLTLSRIGYSELNQAYLGLRQRLALGLTPWGDGLNRFGVAPVVEHVYLPAGDFGPIDLSNSHQVSAMLMFWWDTAI